MGKYEKKIYFQWHFMNSCNLRCAHCYQEGYHYEDLPLDKLMQIGNQITAALRKWNMLGRISLTGGEPFLSPHILTIIDFLEKWDEIKQFDILTNGTCVTEKHIAGLVQAKKLHQIQISLDGPIEEIRTIYEGITVRVNDINSKLTVRRLCPLWINTAHLHCTKNEKIGGFCPVGLTSLAILWDGTVLLCRRLEISIGNILEDGIFKIWYDSDVSWKIRDKNNLQGKCHGCVNIERCGGCRAIAYETTGDYMGEDIQCWI